jgi:hypothetical protein
MIFNSLLSDHRLTTRWFAVQNVMHKCQVPDCWKAMVAGLMLAGFCGLNCVGRLRAFAAPLSDAEQMAAKPPNLNHLVMKPDE